MLSYHVIKLHKYLTFHSTLYSLVNLLVYFNSVHFTLQIIPPHDTGIQHSIEDNLEPWQDAWDTEKAIGDSRLSDPLVEMSSKYFSKVSASMLDKDMNQASPIKFTVTAMHGVSHEYMEEAFRICGFKVCMCVCVCVCIN